MGKFIYYERNLTNWWYLMQRSLVFLLLISFAGLLWDFFLIGYAGWILEGLLMLVLIGGVNIAVIPLSRRTVSI